MEQSYPLGCMATTSNGIGMQDLVTIDRKELQSNGATRLTDVIDSILDGILLFDPDGRLTLWNDRVSTLLPSMARGLVAGISHDVVLRRLVEAANETRPGDQGDAKSRHPANGSTFELSLKDGRFLQLRNRHSSDGSIISTLTDITRLRRAERELSLISNRSRQSGTRILAAAGHDLKQPLQAIRLFASLLADRAGDTDRRDLVDRVLESAGMLEEMLGSLLEFSRLDTDGVEPQWHDVPVNTVLEALARTFAQRAAMNGIGFGIVPSGAVIRTDPQILHRILTHLVDNAARNTTSGRIVLGARRRGDRVVIEVWDTGCGIAEERLAAIFDDFSRFDDVGRPNHHGNTKSLGLGLATVRRLVGVLGARIDVASKVGRGSVFRVTLPSADVTGFGIPGHAA